MVGREERQRTERKGDKGGKEVVAQLIHFDSASEGQLNAGGLVWVV